MTQIKEATLSQKGIDDPERPLVEGCSLGSRRRYSLLTGRMRCFSSSRRMMRQALVLSLLSNLIFTVTPPKFSAKAFNSLLVCVRQIRPQPSGGNLANPHIQGTDFLYRRG